MNAYLALTSGALTSGLRRGFNSCRRSRRRLTAIDSNDLRYCTKHTYDLKVYCLLNLRWGGARNCPARGPSSVTREDKQTPQCIVHASLMTKLLWCLTERLAQKGPFTNDLGQEAFLLILLSFSYMPCFLCTQLNHLHGLALQKATSSFMSVKCSHNYATLKLHADALRKGENQKNVPGGRQSQLLDGRIYREMVGGGKISLQIRKRVLLDKVSPTHIPFATLIPPISNDPVTSYFIIGGFQKSTIFETCWLLTHKLLELINEEFYFLMIDWILTVNFVGILSHFFLFHFLFSCDTLVILFHSLFSCVFVSLLLILNLNSLFVLPLHSIPCLFLTGETFSIMLTQLSAASPFCQLFLLHFCLQPLYSVNPIHVNLIKILLSDLLDTHWRRTLSYLLSWFLLVCSSCTTLSYLVNQDTRMKKSIPLSIQTKIKIERRKVKGKDICSLFSANGWRITTSVEEAERGNSELMMIELEAIKRSESDDVRRGGKQLSQSKSNDEEKEGPFMLRQRAMQVVVQYSVKVRFEMGWLKLWGFPNWGDYLQPPHLCTFPNTLQITLPPPIAADLLPSFPPLPIQPVAAALLPSPPRIPVHPAADLLPFPPLVHPISASR
ncbi:hypothetical protein VP01_647g1 [Puccinia sorghi]|uniref:Uncharacterized protein n=1 Tax=Puccinia sorghi TaxID=27349 RepID=A0A0L6UFQ6_9BASI|nr:hypothetical protein VP01_647g1 [Puccinia sorghi]